MASAGNRAEAEPLAKGTARFHKEVWLEGGIRRFPPVGLCFLGGSRLREGGIPPAEEG